MITQEQIDRLLGVQSLLQPIRSAFNGLDGFVDGAITTARLLNEQQIEVDATIIEAQFTQRYTEYVAKLDEAVAQIWRYVPPEGP